jgi:hypothetical protein
MRPHLLLTCLSLLSSSALSEDRIAFVYELVRHGARAPVGQEPPGYFHVGNSMLTESGMRQRLLLGRYNRQRYVESEAPLMDPEYNPN